MKIWQIAKEQEEQDFKDVEASRALKKTIYLISSPEKVKVCPFYLKTIVNQCNILNMVQ